MFVCVHMHMCVTWFSSVGNLLHEMLPFHLSIPDLEFCLAHSTSPGDITGWVNENMLPLLCMNQLKCVMLLLIIGCLQRALEDVGRSLFFSIGPMPRHHRWFEHLWWVWSFFKVKDRGLTGIVNWKLIFFQKLKSLSQSWGGRWKPNDFHITCPRISITGCFLSFLSISLLCCTILIFSQTLTLTKPLLGMERSWIHYISNAVRVLMFSRGIIVFCCSDCRNPLEF